MEHALPTGETAQLSRNIRTRPQPAFIEQAADNTRQTLILSAAEMKHGLGADTSISGNVPNVRTYTEQQALAQTMLLLEEAMTHPQVPSEIAKRAEDIYENLSFIGEKELQEATKSIADYWKIYLRDNSESSIFIITSKTFATDGADDDAELDELEAADLGHVSTNKSDGFILDQVLGNFTDEELQKYGDRLLLSPVELGDKAPSTVKSIILDDWIMSGQQMRETLEDVFTHMSPADLEINLVVSNKDRLTNGFTHNSSPQPVPVKAAFVSRDAQHSYASEFGGAYLTAAYSSGDYPFEATIEAIVAALNKVSSDAVHMPPLTNIIRPYYAPNYEPRHSERQATLRTMGRSALHEVTIN
ncbi:MAG TPA: hypothetical protein VD907_00975 [Verrucomicrobiae bacterium]|nr:hypothetical protein [Verrucomicrobiae bacterium]